MQSQRGAPSTKKESLWTESITVGMRWKAVLHLGVHLNSFLGLVRSVRGKMMDARLGRKQQ